MDFDLGPAGLLPTMQYAEMVLKQMTPETFFETRYESMKKFGSPIHDAFYKGHEGIGESPSEMFQSLAEFALQTKKLDMSKGKPNNSSDVVYINSFKGNNI